MNEEFLRASLRQADAWIAITSPKQAIPCITGRCYEAGRNGRIDQSMIMRGADPIDRPASTAIHEKERKSLRSINCFSPICRSGKVAEFVILRHLPVVGISPDTYNLESSAG